LSKPVEPLDPEPLPAEWRAPRDAGDDVDGAADTHHERHADRLAELSEPLLLAGRAHGHKQDVGVARAYLCRNLGTLLFLEISVVRAGYRQSWIPLVQSVDRGLEHLCPCS
jgi:hypothetical protein